MTIHFSRKQPTDLCTTYKLFFETLQLNSLEALVKTAEKVFGLPLCLFNENSRLLYQYPKLLLGQPFWDSYLTKKYLDLDIVQEYQAKMLSDKPTDFQPFFYCSNNPEEGNYILSQIYHNNKNYGYITIYMFDNELDKYDIERAKILSSALSYIMFQRNATRSVSLNATLYDALSNENGEYKRSQAVITLGQHLKKAYLLIVKPIGPSANEKAYATMAVRNMPHFRSNIAVTLYENCIVILFGNASTQNYCESEMSAISKIEHFIKPAGIGCGISEGFTDLYALHGYFQQAHMTALYSKEPFEFYENIVPSPIFQLALYYGNADAFQHKVLKQIWQYDEENKTEYFQTLRLYSLLMHNKELTASKLCIHRNTLLYRLNRISEIFNLPYEDPQTALHLLNSFQIWDVINK